MCNDVIVHASQSGFFLYLSPECKVALGYPPHGLTGTQQQHSSSSTRAKAKQTALTPTPTPYPPLHINTEAQLLQCVHPDDLNAMKLLCSEPLHKTGPGSCGSDGSGSSSSSKHGSFTRGGRHTPRRHLHGLGGGFESFSDGTSATSDSDSNETSATLVPLRLQRKDGGYMRLVLPMHPVKERSSKQDPNANNGRSLIGAMPRSGSTAIATQQQQKPGSSGNALGNASASNHEDELGEESSGGSTSITQTSDSLSKLLAEAFSTISSRAPGSRTPGLTGPMGSTKAGEDEKGSSSPSSQRLTITNKSPSAASSPGGGGAAASGGRAAGGVGGNAATSHVKVTTVAQASPVKVTAASSLPSPPPTPQPPPVDVSDRSMAAAAATTAPPQQQQPPAQPQPPAAAAATTSSSTTQPAAFAALLEQQQYGTSATAAAAAQESPAATHRQRRRSLLNSDTGMDLREVARGVLREEEERGERVEREAQQRLAEVEGVGDDDGGGDAPVSAEAIAAQQEALEAAAAARAVAVAAAAEMAEAVAEAARAAAVAAAAEEEEAAALARAEMLRRPGEWITTTSTSSHHQKAHTASLASSANGGSNGGNGGGGNGRHHMQQPHLHGVHPGGSLSPLSDLRAKAGLAPAPAVAASSFSGNRFGALVSTRGTSARGAAKGSPRTVEEGEEGEEDEEEEGGGGAVAAPAAEAAPFTRRGMKWKGLQNNDGRSRRKSKEGDPSPHAAASSSTLVHPDRDTRKLRESAAALNSEANSTTESNGQGNGNGLTAGEAEDSRRMRLEIGRESVRRAQELAKEALLGFFPTALMKWPSPPSSDNPLPEKQPTPQSPLSKEQAPQVVVEGNGGASAAAVEEVEVKEGMAEAAVKAEVEKAVVEAAEEVVNAVEKAMTEEGVKVGAEEKKPASETLIATTISSSSSVAEPPASEVVSGDQPALNGNGSHQSETERPPAEERSSKTAADDDEEEDADGGEAGEEEAAVDVEEEEATAAAAFPPPADEALDDVGLLQLQLLRNYFVSREVSAFSELGAAIHFTNDGPADVTQIRTLLSNNTECSVNDGGTCGWPPLSLALLGGDANIDTVRLLIDAKASLETSPTCRRGQTPLLLAAASRQEACLRALVAAGASLRAHDGDGKLPLMLCASWVPDAKALRACQLLVDMGADASIRGKDGSLAAYACALEAGNAQAAAWLQERARRAQELAESELLNEEVTNSPKRGGNGKGAVAAGSNGGGGKGGGKSAKKKGR